MRRRQEKIDHAAEHARLVEEYQQLLRQVEVAQAAADRERPRLAAAQALGELSAAEAAAQWAKVSADSESMRERLAVLADALPEIQRRVVEDEQERRRRGRTVAANELGKALYARFGAAKVLDRALRDAEIAANELARHRAIVAESTERYALLDGEQFHWPADAPVDENWAISQPLAEALASGPLTPLADASEQAAETARARTRQDDEQISWYCRQPSEQRKTQLPDRLRDHPRVLAADAQWDAKAAKQRRATRRDERALA